MNTTIQFEYTPIIERATMLSAFEAKQAVNTNGESMFEDVRITEKDAPALKAYIDEGAKLLEAQLASSFTIDSTDDSDPTATPPTPATKIIWTFTDIDTRRATLDAAKFTEAIVCFTLSRWCENKIQGTAQSYAAMFKDLAAAAVKIAKTKRKPQRPQES
jgi:hypothetical protein